MILAKVTMKEGVEPLWKLLNMSVNQFSAIAKSRFTSILECHKVDMDFILVAIREKLEREINGCPVVTRKEGT